MHPSNMQRLQNWAKGNEKRLFYVSALALAIPIMLQNGVTNFVSLLDNLMVGRLGTESISGVSIVNQLLFVFNLAVFGATSGVGIFTAQFHGKGDQEGIRQTLRYKLVLCLTITVASMLLFWYKGADLIGLFLYESDQQGDLLLTLSEAQRYLRTMMLGMIPYAISQCYGSTLRETGEAMLPLRAGLLAVLFNIALNYVLIFGKLGMPALGVAGAAVATTVARLVECGIITVMANRQQQRFVYLQGLFTKITKPSAKLVQDMTTRAIPLMVNEMFWAGATTFLAQCYATRGLSVVAAYNIHSTLYNVVSTAFLALGVATGIVVGNLLGADDADGAVLANKRMVRFSILCTLPFIVLLTGLAFVFPLAYDTTTAVQEMARNFMLVGALFIPVQCYLNISYFTLRAGGCTGVTFIFDSVFICFISCPAAYFTSRYTLMPAILIFVLVNCTDVLKSLVGYVLIRRRIWIRNIVNDV